MKGKPNQRKERNQNQTKGFVQFNERREVVEKISFRSKENAEQFSMGIQ